MDEIDYKKLVEAAIFMSPNAIGLAEIAGITGIASTGKIRDLISELTEKYKSADTALAIFEIDGKYLFGLKEPYSSRVSGLASGPDISRGALRLLAYVSKNEGILQSDLTKYFGYATYDHVAELLEKGFIETKKYKRSKKVSTTAKFKEYFNA